MIAYSLSEAVRLLDAAELRGAAEFRGLSTDSRSVQPGQLFIALQGPHFDGHDFVEAAAEKGAAAALVERWLPLDLPQLRVTDALLGLGHLSAAWRARFSLPVLALTGSNGKTTVKEMLAAILRQRGQVLATAGNLNNQIGLPLMLGRIGPEHDYAVLEMGANHFGEIAYLTALAKPDVALINNAGPAHLEGFGNLAGVAHAKGEIYQGLGPAGIAIINHDDTYAEYWRTLNRQRRCISFGFHAKAQLRGEPLSDNRLRIHAGPSHIDITLQLLGEHNQRNALAAATAAWAVGFDLAAIGAGLQSVQAVQGRLQTLAGVYDCTIINDTYNANPASLLAGLRALPASSERWLVLGDMAELGATAASLHEQVGRDIHALGISRLFTLGELSRLTSQAFGAGSAHFTSLSTLIKALRADLADGAAPTILIKGSRSMRMERVVQALTAPHPAEPHPAEPHPAEPHPAEPQPVAPESAPC